MGIKQIYQRLPEPVTKSFDIAACCIADTISARVPSPNEGKDPQRRFSAILFYLDGRNRDSRLQMRLCSITRRLHRSGPWLVQRHAYGAYKRGLTIIEILWFRVVCPPCNGKLDLFKALALNTCPLLEPLLCVGKFLALVIALVNMYTGRDN